MIMLGSAGTSDFDAEMVRALVDVDYGGRGYSCRDPEGNAWSFGTYDPWKAEKSDR